MITYKLEYITTRDITGAIIPAIDFPEPVILEYEFDNYNDADCKRCELCSKFIFGYVRVIETDDLRS